MTIKIYPTQPPSKHIEEHPWEGTIAEWFEAAGIDYTQFDIQPVRVFVDGELLPVEVWASARITNEQEVAFYPTPFGAVGKIFSSVFNLFFGWLMPKGKSGNNRQDPGQGRQLSSAEGKANTAKPNATVPETFGRMLRFPDYLVQPRRVFTAPREQLLHMHLCIGPGQYDHSNAKIGNTLLSEIDGAEYQWHAPGANLSGVESAQNWYNAPEIGGTSGGTAGLDLTADEDTRIDPTGSSYIFVNDGSVTSNMPFPESWAIGTAMSLTMRRTIPVTRVTIPDGSESFRSVNEFTADWREIKPVVGQMLAATGLPNSSVRVSYVDVNPQFVGVIRLSRLVGSEWVEYEDISPANLLIGLSVAGRVYEVTEKINPSKVKLTARSVSGWLGFPDVTLSSANTTWSVQAGTTYGETAGPFVLLPSSEVTRSFEVDFFFPQGLHAINEESGAVMPRSVGVAIEYRSVGASEWIPVSRTYTEATLDQIGYTVRVNIPTAMRPEVRIRRRGARSTSSQVADGIQWYGARCLLQTPVSYPWTTMSVRLRGLGKISANSENQVNVEIQRRLPTLQANGTWSAPVPTRDISAAVWYICSTIGYGVDNINMTELLRLHNLWKARGETFDATLDETTVQQAIQNAFGAGMADLALEDGKIIPVREGIRTIPEQAYSAQNTTQSIRREFTAPREDDKDGVEVEFQDEADGFAVATVKCLLPGSLGLRLEKIKNIGITSRTRAWRIGMRRAREIRYQRWGYSFGTELDALNSSYGSFVSLVGDQASIMLDIQSRNGQALVTTTNDLKWKQGDTHVVAFRRPDGSIAGPWLSTLGANPNQLIAPIPESEWPENFNLGIEPPHVYFGPENSWRWPALIRSVRPSNNDTCSVQAVNYDPRIYADDDATPPPAN